jgi:putative peptidoglycan lipid II flippase
LIAALTVLSRLIGFGRTVVFAHTVGPGQLGDIYVAANLLPNIIFEIVAGGALASLVVPLLAGAAAAGDRRSVSGTTSALLTWVLTLLVPLAVLLALAAGPLIELTAGDASPAQLAAGERMLRIFAPQIPLYGIGIVLTGVLQAHRRFAWPVIAPLLSSVTVIGAYLTFAAVEGAGADFPRVGLGGELILAIGTTLGVVVLSLCLVIPLRGLRLRLRPAYGLVGEQRRAVRGLATAGVVTVAVQQIALFVAVRLALTSGAPRGSAVLYNFAQTVYLLPWAVLAVPVATAAYPALAAARAEGDEQRYRGALAPATRSVLLLSFLGAAALVALAEPAARMLVSGAQVAPLTAGIVGFAPGLVGYGLFAMLSRALYARGETRVTAAATAAGWGVATVSSFALAAGLAQADRVLALALANSLGMAVLGALVLAAVATRAGRAALAGVGRAVGVGLLAGASAAAAGWVAASVTHAVTEGTPTKGGAALQGMLSGVVVVAVFLAVAYPLDRHDVRPMISTVMRRLCRGRWRRDAARGKAVG